MRLDAKLDSLGFLWYLTYYSYISIIRYQFIQCIASIPCQATSSSPTFNDPCSSPNARQQCVARIELIIMISPRRPHPGSFAVQVLKLRQNYNCIKANQALVCVIVIIVGVLQNGGQVVPADSREEKMVSECLAPIIIISG